MKNQTFLIVALFLSTISLESCGLVEGIFKAGMWWAFILIALVVGLIFWLLGRGRKG